MFYTGYYFNFSTSTNRCTRCGMYPPCPDGQSPQAYHESMRSQLALSGTYIVSGTEPVMSGFTGTGSVPFIRRSPEVLLCTAQPTGYSYMSDGRCTPNGFSWSIASACNVYATYVTGMDQATVYGTVYDGDSFMITDGKVNLFYAKTSNITIPNREEWIGHLNITTRESIQNPSFWETTITSEYPGKYIVVLNGTGNSTLTINIIFSASSVLNTKLTDETSVQLNALLSNLRKQGIIGPIGSLG